MSSTWFAAALAFVAGLGGAMQIAVQGRLGDRVGTLEAAAIDRYGWFGVERVALTWPRVLGVGLLVVGAALTLRR
jgi:uncharacterized membrane protein YdcZ (DUF606 family)